jgi:hypothetical protein
VQLRTIGVILETGLKFVAGVDDWGVGVAGDFGDEVYNVPEDVSIEVREEEVCLHSEAASTAFEPEA